MIGVMTIWPRKLPDLGAAPEVRGLHAWFNTPENQPLSLAGLRGRVVLFDFWTYVCGNCTRTLPFLTDLHSRTHASGLTMLGIHTPELGVDRRARNVADAIARHRIRYPVAQDNDMATWDAYGVHYWPTVFLVDAEGRVRHTQVGEGGYRRLDGAVQTLLAERAAGAAAA